MTYFEHRGDQFHPLPFSQSQWSSDSINGQALAGLSAHAVESAWSEAGYRPAKFVLDIFRQPAYAPLQTEVTPVREGRSIRIADVLVRQGERIVARASMVAIRPSQDPTGTRWQPADATMRLTDSLAAQLPRPGILWGSDEHPDRWSISMPEHQNSGRKRLWFDQPQVVADIENTPFVRAAMVGELTNTLTSWSDRGIGFINHDVTMLLARLPIGPVVGIEADNHISSDGIATGSATMWDSSGRFGMSVVGSVAHAAGSLNSASGPEQWAEADSAYQPDFDSAR
ncbi:acyl-CoA thioesterase domain-containing protein [Nocardia sp. NPDC006630]|uniref:acyl-CoA thioesterase domain-containing protein n=1 Tax=Nocardia sp. NPDC006630 TaxID=3157181 RepID=UPI0033BA7043